MLLVVKSKKEKEDKKQAEEEEHGELIEELISEGYEREEVIEALREANFDRDLALQYLENGFDEGHPNNLILNMGENEIDQMDDIELNHAIDDAIDHFLSDPSFRPLREQIRANPSSVDQLVQQVASVNPAFHQILLDNPDITQEIVESVQQFTEEELEREGDENEEWEDENGGVDNQRKFLFFDSLIKRIEQFNGPSFRRRRRPSW